MRLKLDRHSDGEALGKKRARTIVPSRFRAGEHVTAWSARESEGVLENERTALLERIRHIRKEPGLCLRSLTLVGVLGNGHLLAGEPSARTDPVHDVARLVALWPVVLCCSGFAEIGGCGAVCVCVCRAVCVCTLSVSLSLSVRASQCRVMMRRGTCEQPSLHVAPSSPPAWKGKAGRFREGRHCLGTRKEPRLSLRSYQSRKGGVSERKGTVVEQ